MTALRIGACARLLAAVCVFAALAATPLSVGAEPHRRAEAEASYLLSFIRHTDWPPGAMPPPEAPIVVAVYRAPATAAALAAFAEAGELVAGREIEVRASRTRKRLQRDVAGAHVLFVGGDARSALALVQDLVLTVGSGADFNAQGGMLQIVPAGRRLVFDANVAAIRAAGLGLSAKVLALARRVEGQSP